MPWGIFDTQDGLWLGDKQGPKSFMDENLAIVAAELADIRMKWKPGRSRARELPLGSYRWRDDVPNRMTTLEALEGKESGRFI